MSNEYTPTTEEVQDRYIRSEPGYDPPLTPNDPDFAVVAAEFDRWLAVRAAEQQRIGAVEALRSVAQNPEFRLSGHSGISVTRVLALASQMEEE